MSIAANNRWAIYRRACDVAERDGSTYPRPPVEDDGLVDFTRLESRERLAYLDGWQHATGLAGPQQVADARRITNAGPHYVTLFHLGVSECRRLNRYAQQQVPA